MWQDDDPLERDRFVMELHARDNVIRGLATEERFMEILKEHGDYRVR